MDGKSLNITAKKLHRLREIIPEAFTENKVDWEKLKAALGKDIDKYEISEIEKPDRLQKKIRKGWLNEQKN